MRFERRCPVAIRDAFAIDVAKGLNSAELQVKYPRPDGSYYGRRIIQRWMASARANATTDYQDAILSGGIITDGSLTVEPPLATPEESIAQRIAEERSRLDSIAYKAEERR